MNGELAALREDVAPAWLEEPFSIEETAERFVRPVLRRTFVDLCRKPIRDYLERFDFKSDLVKAMYAVTDAFSGLYRHVGHAGYRNEFSCPQHVPITGLRQHVDGRGRRYGHRDSAVRRRCAAPWRGHRDQPRVSRTFSSGAASRAA